MTTQTANTPALEQTVRRLQQEVAELRARVESVADDSAPVSRASRHSPDKLAWAKRHNIDMDQLEPFAAPALGTHTMTVAAAARVLDLSIEQVRRHLRSGKLRGTPLGGRAGWRVSRADVARFEATRRALNSEREPARSAQSHSARTHDGGDS